MQKDSKGSTQVQALLAGGSRSSSSAAELHNRFSECGIVINESSLSEIMVGICSETTEKWNLGVVSFYLSKITKNSRRFDWVKVVRNIDNYNFNCSSINSFSVFTQMFRAVSGAKVPVDALVGGLWENKEKQLFLLKCALECSGDALECVDFTNLVTVKHNQSIEHAVAPANPGFLCVSVYNALLALGNPRWGLQSKVKSILVDASNAYPEYVTVLLAQATEDTGTLREETLMQNMLLFTGLSGSRPASLTIMRRLQVADPRILVWMLRMNFKCCNKAAEVLRVRTIIAGLGGGLEQQVEEGAQPDQLISLWCVESDHAAATAQQKGTATATAGGLQAKVRQALTAQPAYARPLAMFLRYHGQDLRKQQRALEGEGSLLSLDSFNQVLSVLREFPNQVLKEEILELAMFAQRAENGSGGIQGAAAAKPFSPANTQKQQQQAANGADKLDITQQESDAHFMKMYQGHVTVEETVALLSRYKGSQSQKEQEVFRCMLHNLLDEYRFYENYPDRELTLTAHLFGLLIKNQLISSITLGIALRYVLEALRKAPLERGRPHRMFLFGKTTIEEFRARLSEWPQYCAHLLQVPHLGALAPQLKEDAEMAISNPAALSGLVRRTAPHERSSIVTAAAAKPKQQSPGSNEQPQGSPDSNAVATSINPLSMMPKGDSGLGAVAGAAADCSLSAAMGGMSLNMDPMLPAVLPLCFNPRTDPLPLHNLLGEKKQALPTLTRMGGIEEMARVNVDPAAKAVAPPSSKVDPMVMIINNIGMNNYEAKSIELKSMLHRDHYLWFANFMVSKRISAQPNLHGLYLAVLDIVGFGTNELYAAVLEATYYQITRLLQSPNITSSSSERSLLRNLGMWLGQVTLARNRPLLQRRIDLKELVFWGYETGRLIAVCSFVAKVLEGCRDSVVFRPPNPWVMAVLGVLRDLYETEDLKMNIKFEVQVLCKNINISMDSIPRADQIMLCSPPVRDREGRAPDFNVKRVVAGTDGSTASPPGSSGSSPSLGAQATAAAAAGSEQPVIPNLGSYIVVNAGLLFFQKDASRKRLVTLAVDRAIRDVIGPAADSAANIAVTTTRVLVLKDFALEPSEAQLRKAAQLMVSQMASNFAQATCREQLRSTIERKLRALVTGAADPATVDQVVHVCASENLELGCALVEKAAVEKALRDVEVAFGPAYEARRKAREAGRAFRDDATYQENAPANQTILNELPEGLGPSPRGLLPHQQAVYEHFKHLRAAQPAALPATAPTESKSAGGSPQLVGQQQAAAGNALSTGQALEAYQIVLNRLENSLLKVQQQAAGRDISINMLGGDHEIMALLRDVIMVTQRVHTGSRLAVAMTFFETIFKRVVSEPKLNVDPLRIDVMVGAMEALRDACGGPKRFQPDMSAWLLRHATFNVTDDANRRVHLALLLRLIRSKLLKAQEADLYLAAQMDDGRHLLWLELSLALVRQCLVDGLAATYEFSSVFDTVSKARPSTPAVRKQLELWLTDLRAIAASKDEQKPDGGASQQGGVPLPPSMQQQSVPPRAPSAAGGGAAGISKEVVTDLLERWLRIWTSANEQVFAQYLQAMHGYGVLKTIDAADRFFRAAVEVSAEAFESKTAQSRGAPPVYTVMDALSRLFLLLMRLADKEAGAAQLLARILTAVSSAMAARTELALSVPGAPELDQRPYFRVISNLMQDLGEVSANTEPRPRDLALVAAYGQLFLSITPQKLPQFAFSWISLISHRRFLPQLLTGNAQKGWPTMHRLLLTLLSFLEPFLRSAQMTEPVRKLYDATVRILLVVLHDFPEFLSDYHASLCDAIPVTCVQLRNLVLSAFPRAMRLPDPFSTALRVDELEAMKLAPRIASDHSPALGTVRAPLDSFLGVKNAAGQDPPSMSQKHAREFLYSLSAEIGADGAYSLPLLNAVVMHVAVQGGKVMAGGGRSAKDCPPMALLSHLTLTLGPEGRYHLLNAMTNQLRYPNSHTHFFRFALLHLFQNSPMPDTDAVQEQITRVMLERLIVHRPHPWGLLTTFIELIKNPKFNFWKHRFTHGTPEIEKVFDTVARSCLGTSAAALEAAARGGA